MGSNSQGLYLLMVVLALFAAILLPRLRRRRAPSEPPPGRFDPRPRDARSELERLLAEIQDVSREHIARLDTKIRLLNQLLADCDRKKAELEALLGRAASKAPSRPSDPLREQVSSMRSAGKDVDAICAATGLERGEVELILGICGMPPAP